jgi:hypothetical protein
MVERRRARDPRTPSRDSLLFSFPFLARQVGRTKKKALPRKRMRRWERLGREGGQGGGERERERERERRLGGKKVQPTKFIIFAEGRVK